MNPLFKKTSAWLPIAMSLAALALLLTCLVFFGAAQKPEADEGVAAHLFQLLLAGQTPIILFFIIRWLPTAPKQALLILLFQFIAGVLALILLYIFQL